MLQKIKKPSNMPLGADNEEDNYSLLLMYKDYTFLMHIASKKTFSFYSRLKICLTIINIILSASSSASSAAYMNTPYDANKIDNRTLFGMNIIIKSGMAINFVLCIIMGFLYVFEIAQKELYFKIYADNYLRLNNAIVAELSLNKTIQKDFLKFILFEFTFLIENAKYEIPTFIKRRIKKTYSQYNIPPHIDVYINNFKNKSTFTECKNCLRIFKKKCECETKVEKTNDIETSLAVLRMSPIIKNYSFDSQYNYFHDMKTEKVLSNILVYKNENYTEDYDSSNISPLLCNFKISSFNPDTYE